MFLIYTKCHSGPRFIKRRQNHREYPKMWGKHDFQVNLQQLQDKDLKPNGVSIQNTDIHSRLQYENAIIFVKKNNF